MFWLPLVLIVFGAIGVLRSRAIRKEEAGMREFWDREEQANSIRKQDISQLEYITIPLSELPMNESNDTKITQYQDTIRSLSEQKILNLTGISNTELKLQYGPANLEFLSLADGRFTTLARTLASWGCALYDEGNIEDARKVLEFGISCKSDVSAIYFTLAKIYKETGTGSIIRLMECAESLNSLSKNAIINGLQEIGES
ncbi:MAG: hypothetical protein E7241_04820 [Lachnospiraceae bacterium]|jgi:hypothetical protein|nr:hypothetical protein [Lachnospiraceae bacterium]